MYHLVFFKKTRIKCCQLDWYPVFSSFWGGGPFDFQLHTLGAVKLL